jgi:hypothetical protein
MLDEFFIPPKFRVFNEDSIVQWKNYAIALAGCELFAMERSTEAMAQDIILEKYKSHSAMLFKDYADIIPNELRDSGMMMQKSNKISIISETSLSKQIDGNK